MQSERGSSLETGPNPADQLRFRRKCETADALFGVLVEVPGDLLVEDLVSLVDIRNRLVAVVLGLSLLFANTTSLAAHFFPNKTMGSLLVDL